MLSCRMMTVCISRDKTLSHNLTAQTQTGEVVAIKKISITDSKEVCQLA